MFNSLWRRGKYKVLKIIYEYGEVNISRIARESGLNYNYVKKYLRELINMELVNERTFGRAKLYSINYASQKALLLRDVLEALEWIEK
ncbi:MAG: winged helix-turn-helix transcriptional regulator [Fervidicoccaceae archaeon]